MLEEDVEELFLKRIANAVILRALCDLKSDKRTYRYISARNFCLGLGGWYDSLLIWSELAGVEASQVIKKAEEIINAF